MKIKTLFYSAFLGCLSVVYAEDPAAGSGKIPAAAENSEQKCRIGMVTVAEVSTVKPGIQDWDKWEEKLDNHVWAELCINLFPYRGVSRFDFKLAGKYPCVAVAKGNEAYSGKKEKWIIEALDKKDKDKPNPVRLLFAIPKTDAADWAGTRSCTFDLILTEAKHPSNTISFRILPAGQPLSSTSGK